MATLFSVSNLSKSFSARQLFRGLTFLVQEKERIGLIGPNGAGKSTLLKILAGKITADEGSIAAARGMKVGFLEQVPLFSPDSTVMGELLNGFDDHDWEAQIYAEELMSRLELQDGPVASLSGGWKKRVALARELMKKPDLLLLDEPTNHLDVESILWLEDFLQTAACTVITITHDRLFLQRIANRILELDPRNEGGLLSVDGDYATFLDVKDQIMAAQERREVVLKNTLRRETEWLRRGAKARTTKQQARIQRAGDLKEEVSDLEQRNIKRTVRLDFQGADKNPKRLLEAVEVSKKIGDRVLFEKFNFVLTPGSRLGLLGPNGCGKSTLIKVLLGQTPATSGSVKRADNFQVAYFEQNREVLDPESTVQKTLCPNGEYVEFGGSRIHIRGYLDRFLFNADQADMKVARLSGGEQSRLLIAKLMLNPANVLVLDEPTNDLDMATLNVLEECLTEFKGAVIFVTHDRYFLDQVATQILAFGKQGKVLQFSDIAQWESWVVEQEQLERIKNKEAAKAAAKQSEKITAPTDFNSAAPVVKKKLTFSEIHELEKMEDTIHKAEAKLQDLTKESEDPKLASNAKKLQEIASALGAAQAEVERLYARWEDLAARQGVR